MKLDIVKLGDERLRKKSENVEVFDDELKRLASDMEETLIHVKGIGLSAVQVGVLKRLFIVRLPERDETLVFVNPEILKTSEETGPYEEGCLSIPGLYRSVIRPLSLTVQAKDLEGKGFRAEASGLLARVIQHEYDHLNGVLYIDHLSEDERETLLKEYNSKKRFWRRKE